MINTIEIKPTIIPINNNILNKYKTAKEIFDNESLKPYLTIKITTDIKELKGMKLRHYKSKELKDLAYLLFKKYNSNNVFINNNNKIYVTRSGINEIFEKLYTKQKKLFKEHLIIISNLKKIINHAILVNQIYENKCRNDISHWNYYFIKLNINSEIFYLEFDVRSLKKEKINIVYKDYIKMIIVKNQLASNIVKYI